MDNKTIFKDVVTAEAELRELLGEPRELVRRKAIDRLDGHCRAFIAKSPFLVLATADAAGNCDASPRGDGPGFVHVLDDFHLVIPERPGNRRMDSMRNILSNPRVGVIFLIPGLEETLPGLRHPGRRHSEPDGGKRQSAGRWHRGAGGGVLRPLCQGVQALWPLAAGSVAGQGAAAGHGPGAGRPH